MRTMAIRHYCDWCGRRLDSDDRGTRSFDHQGSDNVWQREELCGQCYQAILILRRAFITVAENATKGQNTAVGYYGNKTEAQRS